MDLETLKAIQTPLKENYRNNPEQAVVQLHAIGEVSVRDQQCTVETYSGKTRAGLHPAAGGSSADACSAEMLLESLIACAGVTLGAVATNMSLQIESCTIVATGTMDFRGTLGVDRTAAVGLKNIQLTFRLKSSESPDVQAKLISLTERYCVIYQTLKSGVPIETLTLSS